MSVYLYSGTILKIFKLLRHGDSQIRMDTFVLEKHTREALLSPAARSRAGARGQGGRAIMQGAESSGIYMEGLRSSPVHTPECQPAGTVIFSERHILMLMFLTENKKRKRE